MVSYIQVVDITTTEKEELKMQKITLTVAEVATMLGTSTNTIYTMVREGGQIPHFKVRAKILFNREVIEQWTRGEYQPEELEV